ncbi:hypothetical protein [Draconibacterium halophilum]|uniref:hypothetical protein n=1 Tax=Draconibacterium halophilum TaxID=2706887 RepID=UPI001FE4DDB9|nr:hypothetical protein [Draconibacterium halophilum]
MYKIFITYLFLVTPLLILAQEPSISVAPQQQSADTLLPELSIIAQDTSLQDSSRIDSLGTAQEEQPVIDAPIDYAAIDSMVVSLDGQKVYLYNQAKVTYQNIELEAYYIELDLETKEIYAEGTLDSLGEMTQKPLFRQGRKSMSRKLCAIISKVKRRLLQKLFRHRAKVLFLATEQKKLVKKFSSPKMPNIRPVMLIILTFICT